MHAHALPLQLSPNGHFVMQLQVPSKQSCGCGQSEWALHEIHSAPPSLHAAFGAPASMQASALDSRPSKPIAVTTIVALTSFIAGKRSIAGAVGLSRLRAA